MDYSELFNNTLYGDPLNIIIQHLTLPDIYNLSVTCKKLHNKLHTKIKYRFKKNMVNYLKNIFGEYYNDFINKIYHYNATIYGSFLIECLLEETYENSDIDIYIENSEDFINFTDYMIKIYGIYNSGNLYEFDTTNFKVNDKLIQLVHGKEQREFDFDICSGIVSLDKNYCPIINKLKYNSILNKMCVINNKEYNRHTIKRIFKYSKRGFTFFSDINSLTNVEYELIMNNLFNNKFIYICPFIPMHYWYNYLPYNPTFNTFTYNNIYFKILKCPEICPIHMFLQIPHLHCNRKKYYDEHIILVNKCQFNINQINPHILYPICEEKITSLIYKNKCDCIICRKINLSKYKNDKLNIAIKKHALKIQELEHKIDHKNQPCNECNKGYYVYEKKTRKYDYLYENFKNAFKNIKHNTSLNEYTSKKFE